jgi:hypothetical protein
MFGIKAQDALSKKDSDPLGAIAGQNNINGASVYIHLSRFYLTAGKMQYQSVIAIVRILTRFLYFAATVTLVIFTGVSGMLWVGLSTGTEAMASTASMPEMTLPKIV